MTHHLESVYPVRIRATKFLFHFPSGGYTCNTRQPDSTLTTSTSNIQWLKMYMQTQTIKTTPQPFTTSETQHWTVYLLLFEWTLHRKYPERGTEMSEHDHKIATIFLKSFMSLIFTSALYHTWTFSCSVFLTHQKWHFLCHSHRFPFYLFRKATSYICSRAISTPSPNIDTIETNACLLHEWKMYTRCNSQGV